MSTEENNVDSTAALQEPFPPAEAAPVEVQSEATELPADAGASLYRDNFTSPGTR